MVIGLLPKMNEILVPTKLVYRKPMSDVQREKIGLYVEKNVEKGDPLQSGCPLNLVKQIP